MTVHDVTRHLLQPKKHYGAARMQQGRVLLDSDFNEHAALHEEAQRLGMLDVIGPTGTSDDGFSLDLRVGDSLPTRSVRLGGVPTNVLDVRLRPGVLWLGGVRYELEAAEPAWAQRDFLSMRAEDAPRAEGRRYLAWLEAREQVVSAIEDRELLEHALGGPDTTTRVRRLRRVRFAELPMEGELSCSAFPEVVGEVLGGAFDPATHEVRSDVRLRLEPVEGESAEPCAPPGGGRYLGAENQTLRVTLMAPDRFVWAFDDGAPLYRVQVTGDRVVMLTPPRDAHHAPSPSTVVELVAPGALLDHGEHAADVRGVLVQVREVDAGGAAFTLVDTSPLSALVDAWDAAHPDAARLDDAPLFARFWHVAEDTELTLDATTPTELGTTGLRATFSGTGRVGDHWIASLRPSEPERVVPWELLDASGAAPAGERVWATPLGAFEVSTDTTPVVTSVVDCRRPFRPLTEQRGCCTLTVGDGVESFGDYRTIREALDALPPSGGTICVRAGTYREAVAVVGRRDVTIEGCGPRTVIAMPEDDDALEALIRVERSERVTLRGLRVIAEGAVGVRVGAPNVARDACTIVTLRELAFETSARAVSSRTTRETRSAIEAHATVGLVVRECEVRMDASRSVHAAMYASGAALSFERCTLVTEADEEVPTEARDVAFGAARASFAWGGLQIGGGSAQVRVRECTIVGGMGHGITLGSVIWRTRRGPDFWFWLGGGFGFFDPRDPCPQVRPSWGGWVRIPGLEEVFPISAGDLDDVVIERCRVEGAATNGISVIATLLPRPDEDDELAFEHVTIRGLRVVDNDVRGNVLRPSADVLRRSGVGVLGAVPELVHAGLSFGELVDATIENNRVEGHGPSHREPVCGIYVLLADALQITRNVVRDNGRRTRGAVVDRSTRSGKRGGIVVELAGSGSATGALDMLLRVSGNVVEQPSGPALYAIGSGPMSVENNHLASGGNDDPARTPLFGVVMTLLDLGGAFDPESGTPGFGGQLLVANNQIVLAWADRVRSLAAPVLAFVWSNDDARVVGNQLAAQVRPDARVTASFAHLLAIGATLHVTGNRFSEARGDVTLSLYGLAGVACTVAHNEATHCIFSYCAVPSRHVQAPNLELDTSGCRQLRELFARGSEAGASAPATGPNVTAPVARRDGVATELRVPLELIDERELVLRDARDGFDVLGRAKIRATEERLEARGISRDVLVRDELPRDLVSDPSVRTWREHERRRERLRP